MENEFPMQLESYFYIDTYISPNPSFDNDKKADCKNKISVLIKRERNRIYCAVNLELDTTVSKNYTYNYKIQNFGQFLVNEQLPEKTAKQLIKETGVPILIGAIRERLVLLTSNGPFPPIFLEPVLLDNINYNN